VLQVKRFRDISFTLRDELTGTVIYHACMTQGNRTNGQHDTVLSSSSAAACRVNDIISQ